MSEGRKRPTPDPSKWEPVSLETDFFRKDGEPIESYNNRLHQQEVHRFCFHCEIIRPWVEKNCPKCNRTVCSIYTPAKAKRSSRKQPA